MHKVLSLLALTNYIMIVRYISVFHLKNPGAIKDDFWCLFLNLWTVAATFILNGSNWYQFPFHSNIVPNSWTILSSTENYF